MDNVSAKVRDFYDKFPYPLENSSSDSQLKELYNLCESFQKKTGFQFDGLELLDAGTGTGDRIIEVAKAYPNAHITAIDFSANSLKLAEGKAAAAGVRNIEFREADILAGLKDLPKFDVIFSMGVLHHLSDPALGTKNLAGRLKENGILFSYLYGQLGGQQRMRQKSIIRTLSADDDLDEKLRIAKELRLKPEEYGWHIPGENEGDNIDNLLADCFLNVNERLFTSADIKDLFQSAGLSGFCIFGITTAERGGLFVDLEVNSDRVSAGQALTSTVFPQIRRSPFLLQRYQTLSPTVRYSLMDQLYLPGGYTLVAWNQRFDQLPSFISALQRCGLINLSV